MSKPETNLRSDFDLEEGYACDPERFGVTVATNLGMKTNAFSTKSEARAWLRNQPDPIQTTKHSNTK